MRRTKLPALVESYRVTFSLLFGVPWDQKYGDMPLDVWEDMRRIADLWRQGKLPGR
jgi:hypothetical protein